MEAAQPEGFLGFHIGKCGDIEITHVPQHQIPFADHREQLRPQGPVLDMTFGFELPEQLTTDEIQ
ncbi:MAG: hypothetical protein ABI600_09670, partial [Luteolibacter sp.]